jgi:TonB family protein
MGRGILRGVSPGNSAKVRKSRMRYQRIVSILALTAAIVASTDNTQSQSPPAGRPPVVGPRIVHLVKPDCSAGRSCHGIHGPVRLTVYVLSDGPAGDVDLKDAGGDARLTEAAIAAAKKCRFKPGTFNGKPTSMNFDLTYKF